MKGKSFVINETLPIITITQFPKITIDETNKKYRIVFSLEQRVGNLNFLDDNSNEEEKDEGKENNSQQHTVTIDIIPDNFEEKHKDFNVGEGQIKILIDDKNIDTVLDTQDEIFGQSIRCVFQYLLRKEYKRLEEKRLEKENKMYNKSIFKQKTNKNQQYNECTGDNIDNLQQRNGITADINFLLEFIYDCITNEKDKIKTNAPSSIIETIKKIDTFIYNNLQLENENPVLPKENEKLGFWEKFCRCSCCEANEEKGNLNVNNLNNSLINVNNSNGYINSKNN